MSQRDGATRRASEKGFKVNAIYTRKSYSQGPDPNCAYFFRLPSKPSRRLKGSDLSRPRTVGAEELAGYLRSLEAINLPPPPRTCSTVRVAEPKRHVDMSSDLFLGLDWGDSGKKVRKQIGCCER